MKQLVIFGAIAIGSIFFTSCKKEYTCVCTVNGEEVLRENLGKQKRSDAKDACDKKYTMPGVIAKCELH